MILCHPDSYDFVAKNHDKIMKEHSPASQLSTHVLHTKIECSTLIPSYTYKYIPDKSIAGDRFTDWYDGNGNPPMWAIQIGFFIAERYIPIKISIKSTATLKYSRIYTSADITARKFKHVGYRDPKQPVL